jgi:SAM-dependent methyltransferase
MKKFAWTLVLIHLFFLAGHADWYLQSNEDLSSRFVLYTDERIEKVAELSLPSWWWSRPYEYAWAAKFAKPGLVVLDAACGISHPFKWLLGSTCKDTWACDTDPRLIDDFLLMKETFDDLGEENYKILEGKRALRSKVHLMHRSICNLPEETPSFDRIFCISTLEHLSPQDRVKALSEFARKLTPDGLVVITMDYPFIKPEELLEDARKVGLVPAGSTHVGYPPQNAIVSTTALPGLPLYIYRSTLKLKGTPQRDPRVTLSLIMRNEASRYLPEMLKSAKESITDAVIIDDASTDNSVELAREILRGIPVRIIQNKTSQFSNEVVLRKQQWEETIRTNPEWILFLDADEIFEEKFKHEVKKLVLAKDVWAYYFRLYDFWDESHYRDDAYWQAHQTPRPFLIRYVPGLNYEWRETPQHCGRFPQTIYSFPGKVSDLRLKHFGWAKIEDRLKKYDRYLELDPDAIYGWKEQYASILDENPHLVSWEE